MRHEVVREGVTHTDTLSIVFLLIFAVGRKAVSVCKRDSRDAHGAYAGTERPLTPAVVVHTRAETIADGVHLTVGTLMLTQFVPQLRLPFARVIVPLDETPHLYWCIFASSCGRDAR